MMFTSVPFESARKRKRHRPVNPASFVSRVLTRRSGGAASENVYMSVPFLPTSSHASFGSFVVRRLTDFTSGRHLG